MEDLVHVNVNRALNSIACVIALIAFIATGEPVMLFMLLVVVSFVLLAGPFTRFAVHRARLSFDIKPSCPVGRELALEISLKRPALLRGNIELVFELRNLCLGTTERVPVSLAPAQGAVERYSLPVGTGAVGRISVEIVSARAVDVFGFSYATMPSVVYAASYTVYPRVDDLTVTADRASRMALTGLVFDKYRKGQDLSEVFELRDYREGDSLKAVHWKLSARTDELMVREASHPADFDLALFLGIHGGSSDAARIAQTNAAFSILASLSRAFVHRALGHTVVHRNGRELEAESVDTELGFNGMLDELLSCRLPEDVVGDARSFAIFQRAHGISKLVIVTDVIREALFSEFSALCDLTVIYIGGEGGVTVDESVEYLLIRISTDAVNSRIKSLEL